MMTPMLFLVCLSLAYHLDILDMITSINRIHANETNFCLLDNDAALFNLTERASCISLTSNVFCEYQAQKHVSDLSQKCTSICQWSGCQNLLGCSDFCNCSSDAISSHSANFSTTAFADPSGEFRGSPNTSEPILPSSGERMDSLKHNSSSDRSSQSYSPEKNSYSMDTQDSQVIQQQNQQQEEKINTMDMTTSEHDTKLSGDSAHNSLFDPNSSLESSENNSLSLEMPLDLPDKKSIQHHVTQTPDAQATESNLQMSGELNAVSNLPVIDSLQSTSPDYRRYSIHADRPSSSERRRVRRNDSNRCAADCILDEHRRKEFCSLEEEKMALIQQAALVLSVLVILIIGYLLHALARMSCCSCSRSSSPPSPPPPSTIWQMPRQATPTVSRQRVHAQQRTSQIPPLGQQHPPQLCESAQSYQRREQPPVSSEQTGSENQPIASTSGKVAKMRRFLPFLRTRRPEKVEAIELRLFRPLSTNL